MSKLDDMVVKCAKLAAIPKAKGRFYGGGVGNPLMYLM